MAKIEINKVELVWPGKYNEDGTLKEVPRVSLPFQVIERVNESRVTREARKTGIQQTLFDVWEGKEGETFEEGWKNKLIWGDNLLVMGSLLEKFAGKIDLIYIDPPFATGADFSFTAPIGESGEEVFKEQSVIEEKAYRDTWGQGSASYLSMMTDRIRLMHDLLAPSGTIVLHCDWHVGHALRLQLDEVFGAERFLNEIVWLYKRWTTRVSVLPRLHDSLFWYSKGESYTFNQPMVPNIDPNPSQYVSAKDASGKTVVLRDAAGRPVKREVREEIPAADWWDIPQMSPVSVERLDFPTQKPERLISRIVEMATEPHDLVADFFCGSGTTLAVAEKLGRRWIGCDLSRWAIHVTRKRLLDIPDCKPFEVLNLGKYERQYWSGVTFGDKEDKSRAEQVFYEYLAFILKLYGAQPVAGMAHLHGKKGKAMVHIGAVDAPVTIDEINAAIDECVKVGQKELHVLGWEWEMGLAGPNNDVRRGGVMHEVARQRGVKLLLLQIPREVMEEQAAAKGDVKFFELAYFGVDILRPEPRTVAIRLTDFASPNMDELIPEDIRAKVKKWSDYIDYWAVDWDFQNDTFMQGWVAYRTRKERKLPLASDPHTYEKPGTYRVLVKVVDIFGNDTSQAYDVEVK
ncbi:MAG: site-specific DNA-methyltransferase [Candidatus Bipolaricaulota bacterium]